MLRLLLPAGRLERMWQQCVLEEKITGKLADNRKLVDRSKFSCDARADDIKGLTNAQLASLCEFKKVEFEANSRGRTLVRLDDLLLETPPLPTRSSAETKQSFETPKKPRTSRSRVSTRSSSRRVWKKRQQDPRTCLWICCHFAHIKNTLCNRFAEPPAPPEVTAEDAYRVVADHIWSRAKVLLSLYPPSTMIQEDADVSDDEVWPRL